ncbi:serine protease snake-like isoform X1 [Neodiprion pinetum]|uniref:serine protease snake-like isoform X1 n=1 Tax=Neodiprion pinetum TaxID=441929 RepID=UPI00076FA0DB|nr:serine protease snake-like isoform X1 [Neodiprion pinetum]
MRLFLKRTAFLIPLLVVRYSQVFGVGDKSREKCKEYASFVYADEEVPVLRINAGKSSVSRCGIVEVPLIIGGSKAVRKEFPHMALIGFGNSTISWQCGGSLISESFVLTAAHCLESPNTGPATKVRAGLTNQKNPEDGMQERNIAERIKHPKYQLPARYHDVGLIKVNDPFDLNAEIRPACLHTENDIPGTKGIATGFGKQAFERENGSDDLMKVQLTYVPENDCRKTFKVDIGGRQLPDGLIPSLICAGELGGGKDTCQVIGGFEMKSFSAFPYRLPISLQGDSGGPLQRVLNDPYCMYSIVGVTSFGKFCGFKNSPAIYSRVASYIDWIESNVWP